MVDLTMVDRIDLVPGLAVGTRRAGTVSTVGT
jgi:hypothetical protein